MPSGFLKNLRFDLYLVRWVIEMHDIEIQDKGFFVFFLICLLIPIVF